MGMCGLVGVGVGWGGSPMNFLLEILVCRTCLCGNNIKWIIVLVLFHSLVTLLPFLDSINLYTNEASNREMNTCPVQPY